MQETLAQFLGQEDPLEEERQPTPVFVPGESHAQRNRAGYSPWGCKELDTTEQLSTQRTLPYLSRSTYIPCSSAGKESACNAGDPGSIPGSEGSSGKGYPFSSILELPW